MAASEPQASGLLLKAAREGSLDQNPWTIVQFSGMRCRVSCDALTVSGFRRPVSFAETIEICRTYGWVAPTRDMAQQMWEQAAQRLQYVGLVATKEDQQRMRSVAYSDRFNRLVDAQAQASPDNGLLFGAWKVWLLHPAVREPSVAVNHGFWDRKRNRPVQDCGMAHDWKHDDYSQLLQPWERFAYRDGVKVDLLDWMLKNGCASEAVLNYFR